MKAKGFKKQRPQQSTVLEMWAAYLVEVVPADAGPNQIQETRRAFYAGAWRMLQTMKALGNEDFDDGVAALEAMQNELKDFISGVGKRY